jgi:hypothetical protein
MTNVPASSASTANPGALGLSDLANLRTAPALPAAQRPELRAELESRLAACDWFTIGVMAPTATAALAALGLRTRALDWPALGPTARTRIPKACRARCFLKGNQHSGHFLLRAEAGLGEGILISGHRQRRDRSGRRRHLGPPAPGLF